MIAKLIVWGSDRAQALARLDTALRDTQVLGPAHNADFLRRVVRTDSFAGAQLDTALLEREQAALFDAPGLALDIAAAGLLSFLQHEEQLQGSSDPWSRRDGWRLCGSARRLLQIDVGGTEHALVLEGERGGLQQLSTGALRRRFVAPAVGPTEQVELQLPADGTAAPQRVKLTVHRAGPRWSVHGEAGALEGRLVDPLQRGSAAAAHAGRLTAPMPGKVIALLVRAGEAVRSGQPLAVIEAMKMEHTLSAPRDGVVDSLLYAVGDQVADGDELLRLAESA
jgi:3-methylcrotonyl-CoA carboxylase alpha subunit